MGITDLLQILLKGKSLTDLTGSSDEESEGVDIQDVLNKLGVDTSQIGGMAGGVVSIIELAKKALGKLSISRESDDEAEAEPDEDMGELDIEEFDEPDVDTSDEETDEEVGEELEEEEIEGEDFTEEDLKDDFEEVK